MQLSNKYGASFTYQGGWERSKSYSKGSVVCHVEPVYDTVGSWIDKKQSQLDRLHIPIFLHVHYARNWVSRCLDKWKQRHIIKYEEFWYECVDSHPPVRIQPPLHPQVWEKLGEMRGVAKMEWTTGAPDE